MSPYSLLWANQVDAVPHRCVPVTIYSKSTKSWFLSEYNVVLLMNSSSISFVYSRWMPSCWQRVRFQQHQRVVYCCSHGVVRMRGRYETGAWNTQVDVGVHDAPCLPVLGNTWKKVWTGRSRKKVSRGVSCSQEIFEALVFPPVD